MDHSPSTPLLDQYFKLKKEADDSILLFRVGDFYEAYGEDAKVLSKALEIVLTGREVKGARVPMAGVPYHTLDNHLKTLLKEGFKVAVSEQMEEASDARKLIHRDIVRYLTPGTVLEAEFLEAKEPNYLLAIVATGANYGLSWCDVSTGIWLAAVIPHEKDLLFREISKIDPKEILLPDEAAEVYQFPAFTGGVFRSLHNQELKISRIAFPEESSLQFPPSMPAEAGQASTLLHAYLTKIYCGDPPQLVVPELVEINHYLVLNRPTLRNLELFENLASRGKEGSLLHLLDHTKTAMGGRLLRHWLAHPLVDLKEIEKRHDAIEEMLSKSTLCQDIGKRLSMMGDLERLSAKVSFGTANARDLAAIKHVLKELPGLVQRLASLKTPFYQSWVQAMPDLSGLLALLEKALDENPPVSLKEGGLIREGFMPELDLQKKELEQALQWIAELEQNERKKTGIKSLKVGFNQVFGYYLEVTRSYLSQVPPHYIRKQTLTHAERYIIQALKDQEAKIFGGQERLKNLEYEVFCSIRDQVKGKNEELRTCASLLAQLDCIAALAVVAEHHRFSRPRLNEENSLIIREGRHPVVEAGGLGVFVPNDCALDSGENRLIVLTGPNMAGKSTYLRQVALIVILAQMGSFVPAQSARLGIVDRIFTRIGASDDLHRGESTFFVEMKETAEILKYATPKSLVLLDEIGRGTSTFDGLSLAWATAEELLLKRAKVLFATHYHEMTGLAKLAEGVKNFTVAVSEQGEEVIFLRRILPGGADKSYGIHVAQLAGIPCSVVERAKQVLEQLESQGFGKHVACSDSPPKVNHEVEYRLRQLQSALQELDMNHLTGLQALNLLALWKEAYQA